MQYFFSLVNEGSFPNRSVYPPAFLNECNAVGLPFPSITYTSENICLEFPVELTEEQLTTLSSCVVNHQGTGAEAIPTGLDAEKDLLISYVDAEVRRRVALGFQLTGLSAFTMAPTTFTFSLSEAAQKDYLGLQMSTSILTYPTAWPDKSDTDAILLMDGTEASTFAATSMTNIAAKKMQGANAKIGIRTSTTLEDARGVFVAYMNSPIP